MILLAIPAALLILVVLWDVFEVVVLPRRVQRPLRPARLFTLGLWRAVTALTDRMKPSGRRDNILGYFGPLSLLMLLAAWAAALVVAFGALQAALGSDLRTSGADASWRTDLYLSGTTFFTLGLGDVAPDSTAARIVTVIEAGTGFGFLALVIGYLPTFYQSFSRRETNITLLDVRAGSPPTAGALLRKYEDDEPGLVALLTEWERWSADLLESQLSYPVLSFYRSQHDRQSWVAALTCILDVCSVVKVRYGRGTSRTAQMTFAIARHAAVDLSQIFDQHPAPLPFDRLPQDQLDLLWDSCSSTPGEIDAHQRASLLAMRASYEPYVYAIARYLRMPLPPFMPAPDARADWETDLTGRAGIPGHP